MNGATQLRKLTTAQWIAVPDYFRSAPVHDRSTTHLRTLTEQHKRVTMATLPDGSEYKIDGHKRAYVWRNNLSDNVPDSVIAQVFNVESLDELETLHKTFNGVTD